MRGSVNLSKTVCYRTLASWGLVCLLTPLLAAQGIDLGKLGKEFERVVEKVEPCVVDVLIQEEYLVGSAGATAVPVRKNLFQCSGVIRTRQGEVMTLLRNGLPPARNGGEVVIAITLHTGEVFPAKLKATDPVTGLTLVEIIDPPKLQAARLATGNVGLRAGSLVIAVGSSHGMNHSLQFGIVSSLKRPVRNGTFFFPRAIQTDIAASPGAVGGMLANTAGEMVGMLAFSYGRSQGALPLGGGRVHGIQDGTVDKRGTAERGFTSAGSILAIPADLLERICGELHKRGKVTRGDPGASDSVTLNFTLVFRHRSPIQLRRRGLP